MEPNLIGMVDPVETSSHPAAPALPLRIEGALGPIALFEVRGTVYAIEDGCLRCGTSLVTGALDGTVVTCGACGWRYDVSSGCMVGLPALRLATFPVRQPGARGADRTR